MTCRCRDLRHALMGLARSIEQEKVAFGNPGHLLSEDAPLFPDYLVEDELVANRALRRSLRRARRLLRETRPEKLTESAQQSQCVCACGNKKKWNERLCDTCLYQGPPDLQSEVIDPDLAVTAPGDIAARLDALNRIMAVWKEWDTAEPDTDGSRGVNLWNTIRTIAREFGFGGEDGGSK